MEPSESDSLACIFCLSPFSSPLVLFVSLTIYRHTLSLSRVSSSSPPSPLFSINSNSVSLSLCLWNGEFYFAFLFNVWRSNDLSSRVFIFFFFFGSWSRGCFRRRRLQYLPRSFHPSRPCYCIPLHHSLFIHFFFFLGNKKEIYVSVGIKFRK